MDVRIARLHLPVTVLGPGRRVGVWFQGCALGCPGCMSRDTWPSDGGRLWDVDDLAETILTGVSALQLDGLTISGGEPFQQPEALRRLLTGLRGALPDLDILLYSGLSSAVARTRHQQILDMVDAVVSGPFVSALQSGAPPWAGSTNQVLTLNRHADRYETLPRRRLQVAVDGDDFYILGIPGAGDLERLEGRLAAQGVSFEEVSWRA